MKETGKKLSQEQLDELRANFFLIPSGDTLVPNMANPNYRSETQQVYQARIQELALENDLDIRYQAMYGIRADGMLLGPDEDVVARYEGRNPATGDTNPTPEVLPGRTKR